MCRCAAAIVLLLSENKGKNSLRLMVFDEIASDEKKFYLA
jgi:hypothetical protein